MANPFCCYNILYNVSKITAILIPLKDNFLMCLFFVINKFFPWSNACKAYNAPCSSNDNPCKYRYLPTKSVRYCCNTIC